MAKEQPLIKVYRLCGLLDPRRVRVLRIHLNRSEVGFCPQFWGKGGSSTNLSVIYMNVVLRSDGMQLTRKSSSVLSWVLGTCSWIDLCLWWWQLLRQFQRLYSFECHGEVSWRWALKHSRLRSCWLEPIVSAGCSNLPIDTLVCRSPLILMVIRRLLRNSSYQIDINAPSPAVHFFCQYLLGLGAHECPRLLFVN